MRTSALVRLAVVVTVLGGGLPAVLAAAPPAPPLTVTTTDGPGECSRAARPGGDWPSLNADLSNTRSQPAETALDVAAARDLAPLWSFDLASVGATGGLRSTPVVSGGCVYVAAGEGYLGARGDVVALDADTGALVWHAVVDASLLGLAVADGLVIATPSKGTRGEVATPTVSEDYAPAGSYAIALDARDGRLRWTSERLDDGDPSNGTFVNASPVVYRVPGRSVLFVPLSGGGGDGARVPMWFLDARSGATLRKAHSLSEAEYVAGFGGTGIWTTAAFDPATRHLYAGTSDSDGKTRQHPYNNALLKIDADPRSPRFGDVVDSYAGISERADLDTVVPGFGDTPVCQAFGGRDAQVGLPTFFDTSASPECLELDLDFGASPQLHRGPDGRLRVAALQKAGVHHDVDTATMDRAWAAVVSAGGAANNSATGAVGDGVLHVGATPDLLYGLDASDGSTAWLTTTGLDAFAYQPLTLAAGVLYSLTDTGELLGYDAATGALVLRRSAAADLGRDAAGCLGAGAGVAVARGTVFVPCDSGGLKDVVGVQGPPGALLAYR